jgi:CheY-like chemotaxis protein
VLEDILNHLDKVKKTPSGYIACCPVHDDKNPSMSVTEKDGVVLMHCFSCGANGLDVANSLQISPSALFTDVMMPVTMTRRLKSDLQTDAYVISIYESTKQSNGRLTYNDFKRYKLARERIKVLDTLGGNS